MHCSHEHTRPKSCDSEGSVRVLRGEIRAYLTLPPIVVSFTLLICVSHVIVMETRADANRDASGVNGNQVPAAEHSNARCRAQIDQQVYLMFGVVLT